MRPEAVASPGAVFRPMFGRSLVEPHWARYHVYEKLGVVRLRVNENAWQDQQGRWQSSVDYEMTRALFEQQPWMNGDIG